MAPRIAITVGPDEFTQRNYWETYRNAVAQAGGDPTLVYGRYEVAHIPSLVEQYDGLLLPGGRDVSPDEYGGRHHESVDLASPERDLLELEAARYAKRAGIPTLAICRGCQVVNVALGGTLLEDIPELLEPPGAPIRHQQTPDHGRQDPTHPVDVAAESRLATVLGGGTFATNSMHHQALRRVAHDLRVVARTRDGVIEGVESRDEHPFYVAVQWHPEELVGRDEPSRRLFRAFVAAAEVRAAGRRAASLLR